MIWLLQRSWASTPPFCKATAYLAALRLFVNLSDLFVINQTEIKLTYELVNQFLVQIEKFS